MPRSAAVTLAILLSFAPGCYAAFTALEPIDGGPDGQADLPDAGLDGGPDGGPDGSVQLLPQYELCRVLGLGVPQDVAFSADGSRIAIAAAHEAVRVVDAGDPNREILHLLGHPIDGAFRVRWLSDGALLTVASDGWRIFRPDGTLERFVPDPGVRDVDEGPAGLIALRGGVFTYVARDGTPLRRVETGSFQGHVLHVSPDRARLLITGRQGLRIHTIDGATENGWTQANFDRPAAAWSPDSRWIALSLPPGSGTTGASVVVHAADGTGRVHATGGTHLARALAWSDDGTRILAARTSGVDTFRVEAPAAGETVPAGVALESAIEGGFEMRAAAIGGERGVVLGDEGLVRMLSVGPTVSVSRDLILDLDPLHGVGRTSSGTVETVDGSWGSDVILERRPTRSAVATSGDGRLVAASDGGAVTVTRVDGHVTTFPGLGYVTLLAFSPDGQSLAALANPLLDAEVLFFDLAGETPSGAYPLGRAFDITSLAIADGATHFALGLDEDGIQGVEVRRRDGLLVLDANDGTSSTPAAVEFSPDGTEVALALGGPVRIVALDGSRDRTLPGGPEAVGVAYSGDGTLMVESSDARTVVRDATTGEILAELGPHAPTATGPTPAIDGSGETIVLAGDGVAHVHCASAP